MEVLGMLVIFSLVGGVVLAALSARFPQFYHWKVRGFGRFAEATFQYGLFILTALYFSRVESPQTFLKTHGLNLRPSSYIWFALVGELLDKEKANIGSVHLTVLPRYLLGSMRERITKDCCDAEMEQAKRLLMVLETCPPTLWQLGSG